MEVLTYTIVEAAEAIGISERHMQVLIARNEVPVVRMGRAIRIPKTALATWLDETAFASLRQQAVADYITGQPITGHAPGFLRKSRAKPKNGVPS